MPWAADRASFAVDEKKVVMMAVAELDLRGPPRRPLKFHGIGVGCQSLKSPITATGLGLRRQADKVLPVCDDLSSNSD